MVTDADEDTGVAEDTAEAPDQQLSAETASIKLLRGLVIALLGVMILGFLGLIVLFVTRFASIAEERLLPAQLTLPEGAAAVAYTEGSDWVAVVTDGDEILIFDKSSGVLRQTIQVMTRDAP